MLSMSLCKKLLTGLDQQYRSITTAQMSRHTWLNVYVYPNNNSKEGVLVLAGCLAPQLTLLCFIHSYDYMVIVAPFTSYATIHIFTSLWNLMFVYRILNSLCKMIITNSQSLLGIVMLDVLCMKSFHYNFYRKLSLFPTSKMVTIEKGLLVIVFSICDAALLSFKVMLGLF